MKKNCYRFLFLVFGIGFCLSLASCLNNYKPVLNSDKGINFKITSLAEAKQIAIKSNKPLFVFAHASWCPTCKKMENEVLIQKEVGAAFNKDFLNVAIDVDSKEGKLLDDIYTIRATPTLLFFNADGSMSKKIEGFANASDLLAEASQIKKL